LLFITESIRSRCDPSDPRTAQFNVLDITVAER
jgi:hypothetical protein